MIVFPTGKVHRLARRQIKRFKMGGRHMNDIQRGQRLLSNRDELGGEPIATRSRRWRDIPAGLQALQQSMDRAFIQPRQL
ncbi:Uncharacterised protein [Klebsiella pneumoniae]|nr:Uncharacterised protein [Klebsiella pneumoniae]